MARSDYLRTYCVIKRATEQRIFQKLCFQKCSLERTVLQKQCCYLAFTTSREVGVHEGYATMLAIACYDSTVYEQFKLRSHRMKP